MIVSGLNSAMAWAPFLASDNNGSGCTSVQIVYWIPYLSNSSVTCFVYPKSNNTLSVTMNARFLPSNFKSSNAIGKHPNL